jgi:hypothetical protein
MKVEIPQDVFLIKIENGKLKTKNPHGEEASEKYEELRAVINELCLPQKNKSSE